MEIEGDRRGYVGRGVVSGELVHVGAVLDEHHLERAEDRTPHILTLKP